MLPVSRDLDFWATGKPPKPLSHPGIFKCKVFLILFQGLSHAFEIGLGVAKAFKIILGSICLTGEKF